MAQLEPAVANARGHAVVRFAPAAPAEHQQDAHCDHGEDCQWALNAALARQTLRLAQIVVARAVGDVAQAAIRASRPRAAGHNLPTDARRPVASVEVGALAEVDTVHRHAVVPLGERKPGKCVPSASTGRSDRAGQALHVFGERPLVVVVLLARAHCDTRGGFGGLGSRRAREACPGIDFVRCIVVRAGQARDLVGCTTPCHTGMQGKASGPVQHYWAP